MSSAGTEVWATSHFGTWLSLSLSARTASTVIDSAVLLGTLETCRCSDDSDTARYRRYQWRQRAGGWRLRCRCCEVAFPIERFGLAPSFIKAWYGPRRRDKAGASSLSSVVDQRPGLELLHVISDPVPSNMDVGRLVQRIGRLTRGLGSRHAEALAAYWA
jgi:hypothetical protein